MCVGYKELELLPAGPDGGSEGRYIGVAVLPKGSPDLQPVLQSKILEVRLLQRVQQRCEQVDEYLQERHLHKHLW